MLRAGPRGESIALVLAIKSRVLSATSRQKAGGDTAGLGGVARAALENTEDISPNESLGLADTCKPRCRVILCTYLKGAGPPQYGGPVDRGKSAGRGFPDLAGSGRTGDGRPAGPCRTLG